MSEQIKRIKRELKFQGTILDFYQDTMEINGTHTALWDFIRHKGAAAVVPITEDGKILMVRQYRNALDRYTLEIPAGALDAEEPWEDEARRYFINIVGKYGTQVQALLKKAAGLDIKTICPLHGPVLRENLGHYLGKYDLWSRYEPEEPESVLLAYASIHGNTAQAARKMKDILERKGCPRVAFIDLCRQDQAVAVEEAFRCGRAVFMSPTYDGGLFPAMDHFMAHLRDKTWRKRKAAVIENGSWAPAAAKVMRGYLEAMKDVCLCPTVHTIQGAVKDCDAAAMEQIAAELLS